MMSEERSHGRKTKFVYKHFLSTFSPAFGIRFLYFHFAVGSTNDVARPVSPTQGGEIFSTLEGLKRSGRAQELVILCLGQIRGYSLKEAQTSASGAWGTVKSP